MINSVTMPTPVRAEPAAEVLTIISGHRIYSASSLAAVVAAASVLKIFSEAAVPGAIPTPPGAVTISSTNWKSTLKMPCTVPKKASILQKWKAATSVTVPVAPETAAKKSCPRCGGSGSYTVSQGFFSVRQTCPNCSGSGQIIENPCRKCHGRGQVQVKRNLTIRIPAGVDTGSQLRHTGMGGAGVNGGPAGDLYIALHVRPSGVFERDGNNLYCEVPVNFSIAANGGIIEVPTISGKTKLNVPAGTQNGQILRIKGKGAPSLRRGIGRGDLHIRILVETPVNLSKEQRELLDKFTASLKESNLPRHNTFVKRAGNFLKGE